MTPTSPAAVTSGTHYAIVLNELTGVGGGGKYYWDEYTPSDIYPNGNVWRSSDSGSSWSVGGGGVHDFYFKTYVSGAQYYSNEVHLSKLKEAGSFQKILEDNLLGEVEKLRQIYPVGRREDIIWLGKEFLRGYKEQYKPDEQSLPAMILAQP